MTIKIKTEIEINIGDTLTAEEAQKYIENGGFVRSLEEPSLYYRFSKKLSVWSEASPNWDISDYPTLTVDEGEGYITVENPEVKPDAKDAEISRLKAELEAEKKKRTWLPFPENIPRVLRFMLVQQRVGGVFSKAFYAGQKRFRTEDGFDITDQVKFYMEIE